MDKKKIIDYLKNTNLEELEDILNVISEKVTQTREDNNGLIPLKVFPYCFAIVSHHKDIIKWSKGE